MDTGLAGALTGLTADRLAGLDPALMTEFGGLLETFVVGEVFKQMSWEDERLQAGHFRTHDGVEVDLVVEGSDARIAAIEVKAGSQVRTADLRGLRLLRDRFPQRFVGGVVLYLGPVAYTADSRIHVLPLDRLWA